MSDMYAALRKGGARGLGWQGVVVNLVISSHFAVVPVLLSVTDQVMYTMRSLLTSSRLPSPMFMHHYVNVYNVNVTLFLYMVVYLLFPYW